MSSPVARVLAAAYDGITRLVAPLSESELRDATRCEGFTVADLLQHLVVDAQRALVALHTPAPGPADVDDRSYWAPFRPGHEGSDEGARVVRAWVAAVPRKRFFVELWTETATAATHAAQLAEPHDLVATQGHVLTVEDLLSTLIVEATLHHLDILPNGAAAPAPDPVTLGHTRHVLDGLLGDVAPPQWNTVDYALAAGGRVPLSDEARGVLGPAADRFPLLG